MHKIVDVKDGGKWFDVYLDGDTGNKYRVYEKTSGYGLDGRWRTHKKLLIKYEHLKSALYHIATLV